MTRNSTAVSCLNFSSFLSNSSYTLALETCYDVPSVRYRIERGRNGRWGRLKRFLLGLLFMGLGKRYGLQQLTVYTKMGTGYCMQYLLYCLKNNNNLPTQHIVHSRARAHYEARNLQPSGNIGLLKPCGFLCMWLASESYRKFVLVKAELCLDNWVCYKTIV